MLPELRLLPHETGDLAFGIPLCAPANWRVKTRWVGGEYLVRAVKFREDHRELVARVQGQQDAPLLRLNISKLAASGAEDLIVNDLRMNQFERRLAFDVSGRLIASIEQTDALLHINCMGAASWIDAWEEDCRFAWQGFDCGHYFDEKWRAHTTDAQIEREIGQMLADAASDCSFARKWLHCSCGEREQLIYRVARGSLDEAEALLRAIFASSAGELEGANWALQLDVSVGAGTEFYAGGATEIARSGILQNDDDWQLLAPAQIRSIELVLRHFELWRNWEIQIYTVVQELWRDDRHWRIALPTISMHEKLEARLLLRDFLRDKISTEEMAELLT